MNDLHEDLAVTSGSGNSGFFTPANMSFSLYLRAKIHHESAVSLTLPWPQRGTWVHPHAHTQTHTTEPGALVPNAHTPETTVLRGLREQQRQNCCSQLKSEYKREENLSAKPQSHGEVTEKVSKLVYKNRQLRINCSLIIALNTCF